MPAFVCLSWISFRLVKCKNHLEKTRLSCTQSHCYSQGGQTAKAHFFREPTYDWLVAMQLGTWELNTNTSLLSTLFFNLKKELINFALLFPLGREQTPSTS